MNKIQVPAERMIDEVCKPAEGAKDNGSGLPYVTHAGELEIAGKKIKCYVLSSGERVFDADDIEELFKGLDD